MSYKLPTTIQELPYSFEDIKFPVNRISDNTTFNGKLGLLNENYQQLLNFASVVDNNLPFSHDGIYSFESTLWSTPPTSPTPSNHNYINIEVVEKYTGDYIFICATKTQIDFYNTNINTGLTELIKTLSYTQVKDRGQQKFKNISFIKYNDEKLYVYDTVWESVMVYNMVPFLNDDSLISSIKFLKQFFKLKDIINIDFKIDIYGLTTDSLIIYNRDFNKKNTYNLEKQNPIDIITGDNIFILYQDSIHTYNYSGQKISEFSLTKFDNENTLKFVKSYNDVNIIYLQTKKYIYKYTISGELVGWFNIGSTLNGKEFVDLSILEFDNYDQIFSLDENKLHYFKDKTNIVKLYDEVNLLSQENLDVVNVKNLELEQDVVYNNILQRTLFNNLLLYNSLLFKAMLITDERGVLVYSHKENLVNIDVLDIDPIFYGQNEVFSFQTFNRAFKEIYNIQVKILNLLEFDITENTTNTLII
jgi:hypothetical protein